MEGWPPLFPDASVRGEAANIDSDIELWHERTNATDEPKLTNATDGPDDNVLFVESTKYFPKYFPRYRASGWPGPRGVGACCMSVLGARSPRV